MTDNPVANINKYELSHLVDHLLQAGRSSNVNQILFLETADGRNAWYEAKDRTIGTAEYRTDIHQAWAACQAYSDGFAAECRYALICSSLSGLAQRVLPEMLPALVSQRVWNLERAVAYARATPDIEARAEAEARLIPFMDKTDRENWVREAFESARSIENEASRANAFLLLVSLTPDAKPNILLEGLSENTRRANTPYARRHAGQLLIKAARHIPVAWLQEVIECYRTLEDETPLALVLLLPESDRKAGIEAAIADSRRNVDQESGASRLALLAAALAGKVPRLQHRRLVREAYDAILTNKENLLNQLVLLDLVPYLSPREQKQTLLELLTELRPKIEKNYNERQKLISLAAAVPPRLQKNILNAVREISDKVTRKSVLFDLAPYLDPASREVLLNELLETTREPRSGEWLNEHLETLAPNLSPRQLREALKIIQTSWSGSPRVRGLTALAPVLKKQNRAVALSDAIHLVTELQDDNERRTAIRRMAPLLNKSLLKQALSMQQSLGDKKEWLPTLPKLAVNLPEAGQARAWGLCMSLMPGIKNEWLRLQFMTDMIHLLPQKMRSEALAVARLFEQPVSRVDALAAVAAITPESERLAILDEAAAVAEAIEPIETRLTHLAQMLGPAPWNWRCSMLERITAELDQILELERSAPIFAKLGPFFPEPTLNRLLVEALQKPQPYSRARRALPLIIPLLPEPVVMWLLWSATTRFPDSLKTHELFRRLPKPEITVHFSLDDHDREEAFEALIVRLGELGDPTTAYEIALENPVEGVRTATIAALAPYLTSHLVLKNFERARQMPASSFSAMYISYRRRPEAIGATTIGGGAAREYVLAEFCPSVVQAGLGREALECIKTFEVPEYRAEALVGIAPYLRGSEKELVVRDAIVTLEQVRSDNRRPWLSRLALELAKLSPQVILNVVRSSLLSQSDKTRDRQIEALCCLSPALFAYDGPNATVAVLEAVESVTKWWP